MVVLSRVPARIGCYQAFASRGSSSFRLASRHLWNQSHWIACREECRRYNFAMSEVHAGKWHYERTVGQRLRHGPIGGFV